LREHDEATRKIAPTAAGGQSELLPLGNVDAHVLYQPGRQRSFQEPQAETGKGQGRTAQAPP